MNVISDKYLVTAALAKMPIFALRRPECQDGFLIGVFRARTFCMQAPVSNFSLLEMEFVAVHAACKQLLLIGVLS